MEISQTLNEYLKRWHLSDAHLYAETNSSFIYKITYKSKTAILKIYKEKSDEANSAEVLEYYNGYGAVLPILYDKEAILLEFLSNDISLKHMIIVGRDKEAAAIMVEVIKKLHAIKQSLIPKNLVTLEKRFRLLFLKLEQKNVANIFFKAVELADKYLRQNQNITILHGDIRYDNILHDISRGWLAIDPKGVIGEQTYEVANLICNPHPLKEITYNKSRILYLSKFFAESLNLEQERIIGFAFIHACLACVWDEEDGQDNLYWFNLAMILEEIYLS